jgi:hypothetical protein
LSAFTARQWTSTPRKNSPSNLPKEYSRHECKNPAPISRGGIFVTNLPKANFYHIQNPVVCLLNTNYIP